MRRSAYALIFPSIIIPSICVLLLAGCQTLREIAALRSVEFALDRVSNAELAGVDIQRIRSYDDLRAADVLRIGSAIASGDLPLDFQLHVAAENPAENDVQARMVRMAWTLLIEDRETVSGVVDESFVLPPGEVRDIPIRIELDLIDFFDRSARDLVEVALAVAGEGEPQNIRLTATPTIDTPLGPIEYPEPVTIVSRDLGRTTPSRSQ